MLTPLSELVAPFDDGDIINLSIFNKIFQGNTILEVKKCVPRLNVCLEQQKSIVGLVQNGIKIVMKRHKTFMLATHLNTSQYQPRSHLPVIVNQPLSQLVTSL